MKKILHILIVMTMFLMCFATNLYAEDTGEFIYLSAGFVKAGNDVAKDEEVTFDFDVDDEVGIRVRVDFHFDNTGPKRVSYSFVSRYFEDDMKDILQGADKELRIYEHVEETDEMEFVLEDTFYVERTGTYYLNVDVTGIEDSSGMVEEPEGTYDVLHDRVGLLDLEVNCVEFRYKKSELLEPFDPVKVYVSPNSKATQVVNLRSPRYDAREHYEMTGYYAYREKAKEWLYSDGENFAWYPKGSEPEGYERYNVGQASYGADVYQMETMEKSERVVLRQVWEGDPYLLRFHPNVGGKGSMKNTHCSYNKTKKIRGNTFTHDYKSFAGWKAKRQSDNKWYYTNGTDTEWYKEGEQPAGWTKYIFADREPIKNLTDVYFDAIHMYAIWR